MSNRVGDLYSIVIDNVIKETKNEFEESGDDPAVLEMLKQTWKKRLINMRVTKEPLWGESRGGSGTAAIPPSIPGTVPGSLGTGMGLADQDNIPVNGDSMGLYGMPQIKDLDQSGTSNIGTSGSGMTQPTTSTGSQSHPLYIKDEFGGVQPSSSHPTSSAGSSAPPTAFNPLDSSKPSSINSTTQNPIQLSPELQNQIHNVMNQGNGNVGGSVGSSTTSNQPNINSNNSNINSSSGGPRVPQTDGPQDEELNSDLDDSEDELNSNDEDEDNDQTQIMLCLYEKVHKVKTRWKYTLKDGVANINGYDYVFARATGESEW